jgi:hypothetical protein
MSSARSKREVALIIATTGSGLVLTGLLVLVVARYGQPQHILLLFFAWFLALSFASGYLLWKRKPIGAWGSLAFFALQIVVIERDGSAFWPSYSFGLMIEVFRSDRWEVDVGVSSIVFALLAVGTIRQYWEERVIGKMRQPSLPPNTSLERTGER